MLTALAVTAHAKADDRECALAAGFHAHVAKPVDPTELVEIVASLANHGVLPKKSDEPTQ